MHEISNLDVGQGDAFIALFERGVLIHLNVLVLAVRPGNGELGFIDGLHLARYELLAQVFAVELLAPCSTLLEALRHLRIYNPQHGRIHGVAIPLSTRKDGFVYLDVAELDGLPFFEDAGIISDFYRDWIASRKGRNRYEIAADSRDLADNVFARREIPFHALLHNLRECRSQAQAQQDRHPYQFFHSQRLPLRETYSIVSV